MVLMLPSQNKIKKINPKLDLYFFMERLDQRIEIFRKWILIIIDFQL